MNRAADVRIRPATEEDVPLILALIRALAAHEGRPDDVVATEDRLRETLFGPRPAARVIIAGAAEAALGCAIFFHSYSSFLASPALHLEDLYVRPEARARGIGRALLAHLARLANERGCCRMEWSVVDRNESAIGFYERIGAQRMDERIVYRLSGSSLDRLGATT